MKSKWLVSLGLVVCLVMAFALPMCAPAPPAEEEAPPVEEEELASSIKCYTTMSKDFVETLSERIVDELGVRVHSLVMSGGETDARLKAEAPNFAADMVINHYAPGAFMAKEEGWCVPYASPEWEGAPEAFVDPDGVITKTSNFAAILVGNKDLLDAAGYTLPDSWDDLLDPKWKGEIVVPSAVASSNGWLILQGAIQIYGFNKGLTGREAEDAGFKYLEKLDKNIHHYTKSGFAPGELVGRGEFMLGMTQEQSVWLRMKEGYPVMWGPLKEGFAYGGSFAYILKGTKEVYTCQKIIDFIGTPEILRLYAEVGSYVTKDPTVLPAVYKETGLPPFISGFDEEWFTKEKRRLLTEWEERILG